MRRGFILTAVLAAALGFWAGVSAWQSAGVETNVLAGGAMLIAGNLLFCLWIWRRAPPGSGDAMVMPPLVVSSAAMLLGILPRLFWPDAEGLQIAGSIASVVIVTVLVVRQARNRRRLRRAARPV